MEIPQEIRTKISQLEDLSREIKEWFDENYDEIENIPDSAAINLYDDLSELETDITIFQESQNWI